MDLSTVCVVDSHPRSRRSLGELLAPRHRVRTYAALDAFLDEYSLELRGCLLIDAAGPCVLESLQRLQEARVVLPAIIVSPTTEVETVVAAMRSGALNYLQKPCDDGRVMAAVDEAFAWDEEHRQQRIVRAKNGRRLARLTRGERAVLSLLLAGYSNQSAAESLEISVRAVEVRRAKLMKKMAARSLAELVRMAITAEPSAAAQTVSQRFIPSTQFHQPDSAAAIPYREV